MTPVIYGPFCWLKSVWSDLVVFIYMKDDFLEHSKYISSNWTESTQNCLQISILIFFLPFWRMLGSTKIFSKLWAEENFQNWTYCVLEIHFLIGLSKPVDGGGGIISLRENKQIKLANIDNMKENYSFTIRQKMINKLGVSPYHAI